MVYSSSGRNLANGDEYMLQYYYEHHENDKYDLYSVAEGEGVVKSKVIEGLNVDIKDVFDD